MFPLYGSYLRPNFGDGQRLYWDFNKGNSALDKILGYSPIAYWPLLEASGDVAEDVSGNDFHGAFANVTLGQEGIGDGLTCPLFNGTDSVVDVYSTGFRDAFNGAEGSVVVWAKVLNAGVWEDGNNRGICRLRSGGSNYVHLKKDNTNNRLEGYYVANGTFKNVVEEGVSSVAWMHLAFTWSKSAGANGEVIYYRAGSQVGGTLTALGVWAGSLASTTTCIGADGKNGSNSFSGYLAHPAVFDTVKTPTEILDMATV